ncbi:MAG: hypothetical protein ACI9QV_000689 [Methylophagaceae bacterium]|jgi:hypothetical protein
MNIKNKSLAIAMTLAMSPLASQAMGTISFGENQSVSVGFGAISSFSSTEDAANDGGRSNDFALNIARIYFAGQLNEHISGMFNVENSGGIEEAVAGEVSSSRTFEVLDAVGIFKVSDNVDIYAGRFLSPSSRANMAGPFFASGGGYWQNLASRYGFNGGIIGRDEGIAVVATTANERLAYSFGAFEGGNIFRLTGLATESSTNSMQDDDLMYAGRLQYSFWDTEPGYYGTGNYLGAKDIFTIGVAARTKGDGAASTTAVGDYNQWSADLLIEKKLAAGAVSVEAAYYDYDTDDVFLSEQGDAYSAGLGFIFSEKVGWGQFMPFVRYQSFDNDLDIETERTDLGVNYIIDGYNAQITTEYRMSETDGAEDQDQFLVTMQLQF